MNCSTNGLTLAHFRNRLYHCFGNGKDALMNACDALLTEVSARSFPELSLSPFFVRRWPSLYEAFDDAQVNRPALQRLFVETALGLTGSRSTQAAQTRLVLAADATPIVRSQSPTARDRTYVHVPNLPKAAKPVAPGWQFATVVALPEQPNNRTQPNSWTMILDNRRIPSQKTPCQVVASQLQELSSLLPEDAIVLCDGGFGNPGFLSGVHHLPQGKLLRLAKNRTLYRPAPPRTGKSGAPKKDGAPFALPDASTQGVPEEEWSGQDEQGGSLEVTCWHHLHFKKCREAEVSLLRVRHPDAPDSKQGSLHEPGVLWLLWQGPEMPALCEIVPLYRRRFSIEQSYRFDKQELLWTQPRLRTPEKFEAWTDVVSAVHDQITLAHSITEGVRHPWESRRREPTPQQVRRACGTIIAQLGTPASAPQVRGKSPGRRPGAMMKKAERFATILKQKSMKKLLV